jgi:hypothetical protein
MVQLGPVAVEPGSVTFDMCAAKAADALTRASTPGFDLGSAAQLIDVARSWITLAEVVAAQARPVEVVVGGDQRFAKATGLA